MNNIESPLLDDQSIPDNVSDPWLQTPVLRSKKATFNPISSCIRNNVQNIIFGFTVFGLVVAGIAEAVSYSVNGQKTMVPFRSFLNILVIGVCGTFFGTIGFRHAVLSSLVVKCANKPVVTIVYFQNTKDDPTIGNGQIEAPLKLRLLWFFGIAILDCTSLYIALLASTYISPPLRAISQQLTIPFSMTASFIFLNRRFTRIHVLGALTVLVGIIICLIPIFNGRHENGQVSRSGWVIAYSLSCLFLALGGCLKEFVLTHKTYPQEMNKVNAWVALFQFCLSLLLTPVGIYIQNDDTKNITIAFADIPENFYQGFTCGVLGIDTGGNNYTESSHPNICSEAVVSTWIYIASVFVFNILMLYVIREGTVVVFFIATSLTIAIVSVDLNLYEDLDINVGKYTVSQVIGLVFTILGTILFQSQHQSITSLDQEEVRSSFDHDSESEQSEMYDTDSQTSCI